MKERPAPYDPMNPPAGPFWGFVALAPRVLGLVLAIALVFAVPIGLVAFLGWSLFQ